jgi:hypothetical protein
MSKRTIVGAAVLLAVALSVPLAVNAQDPPDGVALSRVERSFGARDWNCIDPCHGYPLRISTPADVDEVDLVVTATFTYHIPEGFRATARLGWATGIPPIVPCCGDEPSTALAPGRFPLQSTGGKRETRTLTWIATGLPAAGEDYRLYLSFATNAPPVSALHTGSSKAALVAEVWSAGDR